MTSVKVYFNCILHHHSHFLTSPINAGNGLKLNNTSWIYWWQTKTVHLLWQHWRWTLSYCK